MNKKTNDITEKDI